jgi:hypothetical protein
MKLIAVLTINLTCTALDWVVAKCEGKTENPLNDSHYGTYAPSTNWAQGGPIVDRGITQVIKMSHNELGTWYEVCWGVQGDGSHAKHTGNTILEAAMRCYVASKLGDKVEVPSQLVTDIPLDILNKLWIDLSDIPTVFEDENVDEIDQDFLHFPKGTHREKIWHWFETMNQKFSVGKVMSGTHLLIRQ